MSNPSARPLSNANGLTVENVGYGFGNTDVLADVTLSVEREEVLVVIGPSGTGKTTLLRLAALFTRPDNGVVRFDGTEVWSVSQAERLAARRNISMVFQKPNLFDTTVGRNVAYGLHIRRPWTERVRHSIERFNGKEPAEVSGALEVVGLSERTDERALKLSGGEAQRVAFARALACNPEFLLLDEPTSDLDPRNTAVIEEAVETARSRGLGVLVATHDMHQAERIADRVAVMIEGKIVEVDDVGRIFTDPADERVGRFIDGELVY